MATSGGLVLSAAETARLCGVLGDAGRTLAIDEADHDVSGGQRLAPRLERVEHDLVGRVLDARKARVRLDVPVRLDPAETATVLGLLERAAARLEAVAARRAEGQFLLGPAYFRDQAATVRAWRADLGGLAERQHHRAACAPPRAAGPVQEVER